jgi:DNA-directed RNA polymerase specialized sigma24 family protein
MSDATCWTLIEGAAAGDSASRAIFTSRYLPMVRAFLEARWKGRRAHADLEDAVQETFLECLREEGALERVGGRDGREFRPFLLGVVRNVALRFETARARRKDSPGSETFQADALPVDEESLSRVFDRAWAETILREAAIRQEHAARGSDDGARRRVELLREVFREGRTIAELARLWAVDANALHHEYARARTEFLEALKEVVAFHHPHAPERVAKECREIARLLA